jgi:IS30 family transposase
VKKELMDQRGSKRRMRRSRHASEHGQSRGQIVDATSIRERPAEAVDRAIPGHWEGDLLAGGKNSYVATLVERHSRFLMLIEVPSKDTAVVVAALSTHVRKLPTTLRRSLTWDRGLEMAKHRPGPYLSSAARPGLAALESTPKRNPRVPDSCE